MSARQLAMAHDVFISHSARDKPFADAVCAKLESRNIRCWIAPRDIRPGMTWGSAIVEAIDHARVMLLIFSPHANTSPQISREVELAVNKGLVVMPVRVEDTKPSGDLEYFLGTPHWLDAIAPPFEQHLDHIADSAKFWLEGVQSGSVVSEALRPPKPARDEPPDAVAPAANVGTRPRRKWRVPSIAALLIAIGGTAAFFGARYYLAQQQQVEAQPHEGQPEAQAKGAEHTTAPGTARDPEIVIVPAGSFTMGSPSSEPGRYDNEGPQHQVTIGYSFAVGKYPVTRDEYAQFAAESGANSAWQNPGYAQTGKDPVVNVSWDDAKAYVRWLSRKTGKNYRLLSEAEYEYAERAATSTAYWWGDSDADLCKYANGYPCHKNGTVPVGTYPPNAFGLNDMAGNAWEWTEDCWHDSYARAPHDGTPWEAGACAQRVMRGGSWNYTAGDLRSAVRVKMTSGFRLVVSGFRVARTL